MIDRLRTSIMLSPALRRVRSLLARAGILERKYQSAFSQIYNDRYWGSDESVSGGGSTFEATSRVRAILPAVLKQKEISTLLDVPCGDFNWMRQVDLDEIDYTGGDIVPELIASNNSQHTRKNVRFRLIDVINDPLPRADLVLCRDCLVHLPLMDIMKALRNIVGSGSKWLLTTTFTDRMHNADIAAGKWRPLNLQVEPFCLPEPEALFNEECTEADGKYADKSLGLWSCRSIRDAIG